MNRVAIDIDEVLMPFVKPMAEWRGHKMPRRRGYNYIYREMFEISEFESQKMVREFYDSSVFDMIEPIDGAQEAIENLRSRATKIYAVTGRQQPVREKTEEWLNLHFPHVFDDLILTNSFTVHEIAKVDVCSGLNLDTIIDDSELNCLSCASEGINAIHFGGIKGELYPWCKFTENTIVDWGELEIENI